ncbi:hypothetical protein FJ364_05770 [Candidatus Dependentiae bacterium]|nr:hypothetical protein [Candidatus Dependentiae bacterium]
MRTHTHTRSDIHFANYYAVELLESCFGKKDPEETEIFRLEKQIKKNSVHHSKSTKSERCNLKALILSSDSLEQNTLALMFQTKGITAEHIRTKEDLFDQFPKKQDYAVVIVSDHFEDMGLNFLVMYFRSFETPPFLIYLGSDPKVNYCTMGFDAHLQHPFFTEDLMSILPDF